MGETLIGPRALHIRACFSRSATACKIRTIPSASVTASKQIHITPTAVQEQVSVDFCPVSDLLSPDQRGLFPCIDAAHHLSGKIFRKDLLEGSREDIRS